MSNTSIRLGDVATYINGYAFKPEDRGTEGLPIIRIQDLTGNAYDLGFYNGDYPEKIEINDGDVLISWSASLGVYIWNRGKALLNQHIFKVSFDKAPIDKQYFIYAVRHKLAEMGSKAHGATMKHIVKKDFDATLIPYPPISEQENISLKLNKVSNIIEARQQELQKLDELVKSRFIEMFGDPILNNKQWKIDSLVNVTNKIGSGATPKGGKESYQAEGISLIRSLNVHDGGFEYDDLAHITDAQAKELDNVKIEKNDVFINITGASVARSCIVPDNVLPARVNQHVSIVRCKPDVVNYIFINQMFLNPSYKKHLLAMGEAGGATRQAITKQQLEKLVIIVPPLSLQNQFAAFVQQVDKSKFVIKQSIEKLELLKSKLMQDYFG